MVGHGGHPCVTICPPRRFNNCPGKRFFLARTYLSSISDTPADMEFVKVRPYGLLRPVVKQPAAGRQRLAKGQEIP